MNYYKEIENKIINYESFKIVKDYSKNKKQLETYYEVGKLLIEAQGGEERATYGNRLIEEYSVKLTQKFGKGYTFTDLTRMRKFYILYKNIATVSQQITWSHYVEIISLKDKNAINYYTNIAENQNLSVRELRERIKLKEYERLDEETKKKLVSNKQEEITLLETVTDPVIIYTNSNIKEITHEMLELSILEDLTGFLRRLGEGYMFVGNEYKIKIGNKLRFIDILLFNIKYNSYVVLELKTSEANERDYGQIKAYMRYIDDTLKTPEQNNTLGIIICRTYDEIIFNYLKDDSIKTIRFKLEEKI